MAKIAIVQAVASDLTGVRGEEAEFGKLTVRRHPAINGTAKVLDVKPDEIEGLEQIGDVVFLDYEPPGGGEVQELVVKREDFDVERSSFLSAFLAAPNRRRCEMIFDISASTWRL